MNIIMGIAPSRHSAKIDGVSVAWCDKASSGRKVRMLADPDRLRFANASDVYPGTYTNSKGEEVDRTPWVSTGFERLVEYAETASTDCPVDILLLGCEYWSRVISMAASKGRLALNGNVAIASPVPFRNEAGAVAANLFLFPHPYFWPVEEGYDQATYRAKTVDVLAKLKQPPFDTLGAAEINAVFSRFGLGLPAPKCGRPAA